MLYVHRAERADHLVAGVCELLAEPLSDPMAEEVIAVHTRGMERWLAQRLSGRLGTSPGRSDGMCANVAFPTPARLTRDAVAVASGIEAEEDPWLRERLVWPLVDLIDEHLNDDWLKMLAGYIGGPDHDGGAARQGRRFASARHLAALFDRYALLRPEMVEAWRGGKDTDAEGNPLPEEWAWQAELWRRVAEHLPLPGPAERTQSACERLRDEAEILDLPSRICLFGLTRLPAGHLRVLSALASEREVHAFVLHPSPALWDRIAAETPNGANGARRSQDPTAALADNPLLRSWGKDARELELVLGSAGEFADEHRASEADGSSLLDRVQSDIRADRPAPGPPAEGKKDERLELEADDLSIRVHACHGRARQVEVLREAILHALAENPELEPRDVIVMCPDIETFAPLIQASFGGAEASSGEEADEEAEITRLPELRVRLADRSLRQTNPVLGVVARILELAEGRVSASQILDLSDSEPVRQRFGFDDDALSQLEAWVSASGIHWGLDGPHRKAFQMERVSEGTWRAGLDRVLLGVAMSEEGERLYGGVLPLDDVPSVAIELAGHFAELIDRLETAFDELSAAKPIDAWLAAIADAADALTATLPWEEWQRAELGRILETVASEAANEEGSSQIELSLAEIRALLAERLAGRPTWSNFRTGHLTICTLQPMRSVPHPVVCLLGLDDGVFPRHSARDGDDLTLNDPQIGERDPRLEDRQLLLDAVVSATDRLIVTYTGNDERTNIPRPPAVPVGELLDLIDQTARGPGAAAAREAVLVRHPLQPFDPRNFTPDELRAGKPWGFDEVDLSGAEALAGERASADGFLSGPLAEPSLEVIELDELVRFLQHPVRAFLRQRLGISLYMGDEELEDGLPVELDGLAEWAIGQRLLEARLSGISEEDAIAAEAARGELPPGELGRPVISRIGATVEELVAEIAKLPAATAEPESLDVRLELAGGRLVSGMVPGVRGGILRTATFSRVSAKQRLAGWVRLLCLSAAYPDREFSGLVIGRIRKGKRGVTVARVPALGGDAAARRGVALAELAVLVDIYERGMCEPLPIACAASAAYAAAQKAGKNAESATRSAWESSYNFDKEDKDEEHLLVWGGQRRFDAFLEEAPRSEEAGEGWDEDEDSRFGRYAVRLWSGLLAHEGIEDR